MPGRTVRAPQLESPLSGKSRREVAPDFLRNKEKAPWNIAPQCLNRSSDLPALPDEQHRRDGERGCSQSEQPPYCRAAHGLFPIMLSMLLSSLPGKSSLILVTIRSRDLAGSSRYAFVTASYPHTASGGWRTETGIPYSVPFLLLSLAKSVITRYVCI